MVQRAADVGRGIRTSSGQEGRCGHPSAPWDKERALSSTWCVPSGWGPTRGGVGRRLLDVLPQPGLRDWGRAGCQDLGFGLWCPISPLFLQVWLRPAFCCSCCRWQQKPGKAHLFRAARGEEMQSGPGSLQPLLSAQWLDWELRG